MRIAAPIAVLGLLLAATPVPASEGFSPPRPGPEAAGRAGADIALSAEAAALHSNPAGLARLRRNRSDLSIAGMFNKLDFETSSGTNYNGDRDAWGGNFAYAFIPSKLVTDPFRDWASIKQEALETFTARSRFGGELRTDLAGPPPESLKIRGKGLGVWVSDLVLRGRIRADRVRIRYDMPTIPALPPRRPALECKVEFEYRRTGPPGPPPSMTLTAYGGNASILLDPPEAEWTRAEIKMVIERGTVPPDVSLTAILEEGDLEIRRVTFHRVFGQAGRRNEERLPIPDAELRRDVDPGLGSVILATAPGPFSLDQREEDLWILDDPERFLGETLTGLVLEFRYGFEGAAAEGELVLVVDGRESDRFVLEPEPDTGTGEEEMDRRRRTVEWIEREKIHLGVGFFTDAWAASAYNDLPSDAGVHGGEFAYGLYSFSLGAAVEVHPMFSFGFALDVVHARLTDLDGLFAQDASILGAYAGAYRLVTGRDDVSLQLDADDLATWGASGRFGILVRPSEAFALGAVVQAPVYTGTFEGRMNVDFTDDFEFQNFDTWIAANISLPLGGDTGYGGEYDVHLRGFHMPARAGVGVALQPVPELTLALDAEYVAWSSTTERLTLELKRGSNPNTDTITGATFKARIPLQLRDQFIGAIGLSADLSEDVTVHTGYRFASNPVEPESAHPLFAAHGQHFVALGATLRYHTLSFHIAVQHGFDAALDVGDSLHGPLFDGSRFTLREETAVLGVSYEY